MGRRKDVYDRPKTMVIICELIATGSTLQGICKENEDLPSLSTVMLWIAEDSKLSEMYAHARQNQADVFADEIITIADSSTALTWGVDRLRIDARKWHASKSAPKRYGDKVDVEHGGNVGVAVVVKEIPVRFLDPDPTLPVE